MSTSFVILVALGVVVVCLVVMLGAVIVGALAGAAIAVGSVLAGMQTAVRARAGQEPVPPLRQLQTFLGQYVEKRERQHAATRAPKPNPPQPPHHAAPAADAAAGTDAEPPPEQTVSTNPNAKPPAPEGVKPQHRF